MITYRLVFAVFDDTSETPHVAIYRNLASLDVATLRSVDDRFAFDSLSSILRVELLSTGSTVLEKRALSPLLSPLAEPHEDESIEPCE